MSTASQRTTVPRLGGSSVGYVLARPYDPARRPQVLINSFTTSIVLFRDQFADAKLGDGCVSPPSTCVTATATNSARAELRIVGGGPDFLSATHPDTVNAAAIEFLDRWT